MASQLIDKIEFLHKELQSLLPMRDEWQERLDKKFRLEFNYNSNHIEGNTLTYGETMLYLIFDKTIGEHDGREYEEMKASDVSLKMIQEYAMDKERPLTETFIKDLNRISLVRPYWANAITPDGQATKRLITIGDYKKQPNSVRLQNGEFFHYASPDETPIKMGELIEWYREEIEKNDLHPVTLAALVHYRFVRIHPFDDGNGRISRLLMNYVLYYFGYPPVIVKSIDKKNYLLALNRADTGDINVFTDYIAEQLVWSLELSIRAANGLSIEESSDWEKRISQIKKEYGFEQDEKIELRYTSPNAVDNVIEKAVRPLISKWEEILVQFDSFFFSRTFTVVTAGISREGFSAIETFNDIYRDILTKKIKISRIPEFKFTCCFQQLRNFDTNSNNSFNGGSVDFIFRDNAYQIVFPGSDQTISKLYHQQLSTEEINKIINSIANILANAIENHYQR